MASTPLTPFEHAVCAWILKLESRWLEPKWDRLAATLEKAFLRGVRGGFAEAKLLVETTLQGPRRTLYTLWRVTGGYEEPLAQSLRAFVDAHVGADATFHVRDHPFLAGRLTAEGELAKRDLTDGSEFKDPCDTRPGLPRDIVDLITGGPDGSRGYVAPGEVLLLSYHEPAVPEADRRKAPAAVPAAPPSPLSVALTPESLTPLAGPLKSIEEAVRAGHTSPPQPPAPTGPLPAPSPEGPSPDIVKKLDALLRAAKYKQSIGRSGAWRPRDKAHNNRIVEQLLGAVPDVTARDAATILGASAHTLVVRADAWKRRRGDDGADASGYAEHHQNMQRDRDPKSVDPADIVADREEQAAALRRVAVAAGLTSMLGDIRDDNQLLDAVARLSMQDPAAYERLQRAWVVQCTTTHQTEQS